MHLAFGLFFERLPDGWVKMTKRETTERDSPSVFELVTDANGWASIVEAMQTESETVGGSTPEFVLTRVAPEPVGETATEAAPTESTPEGG